MCKIYWLEDEIYLLKRTRAKLIDLGHTVVELQTVSDVINRAAEIERDRGPIILDLYLPPGGSSEVPGQLVGSELGIWILGKLQQRLGTTTPFVILSGNISLSVAERLSNEFKIPDERVFPKPLIESDAFIELIDSLITEMESEKNAL